MRQRLWILSLVLPICGCYVAQPAPVYAPQAYPSSGYPAAGYPPPPYPGYSYNDGAPTIIEEGVSVPLVVFGGQWGFYDRDHRWHRAPDAVYRDLDRRRQEGSFRPGGAPPPDAGRPGFRGPPQDRGAGPPPGFRPPGPAQPAAGRPVGPPPQPERRDDRRRDCPPGQRC